jgi:type 1 fimbriae regulatory protein FimB/type 1 fimbriae regulatory protein FimE
MALSRVLRTVTIDGVPVRAPGRRSDAEIGRVRKYLTPEEVELLIRTAKKRGRHGARDALAIRMAYRHGLRVSELVGMRWCHIGWTSTPLRLTVARCKGSIKGIEQLLDEDDVRALKKMQRAAVDPVNGLIFTGERGKVSVAWFQRKLKRTGTECGLPLVHPHMLRHACGYALADRGKDLREIQLQLGHKSISNTMHYVELRPGRLDHIWD